MEYGDPDTAGARFRTAAYGIFVFLKWPLVLGGLVLLVVGIFNNGLLLWGALALAAGAAVQVIGSAIMQRRILALTTEALGGKGPVPGRQLRTALMHRAISENDVRIESHEETFVRILREWAAQQPPE